jgi:hypothetical protein
MTHVTRRALLGGAGLLLGAVSTAGAAPAIGPATAPPTPTPTPTPKDFPYEQHLKPDYRLDAAAVREAAYQAYYAGGCCHGAYSALLGDLAQRAGAPFDQLPLDFGKFGAGGIATYGSVCGAALGGVLVVNMVVANAQARGAMMTDLLRWYEGTAFPAYVPKAKHAKEAAGVTLDFSPAAIVKLQRAPRSHLCHASVSDWCAANGVAASSPDKLARCARLTADVAGKTAEVLNAYLAARAYTAAPPDAESAGCVACHTAATTTESVATGMRCDACHDRHDAT